MRINQQGGMAEEFDFYSGRVGAEQLTISGNYAFPETSVALVWFVTSTVASVNVKLPTLKRGRGLVIANDATFGVASTLNIQTSAGVAITSLIPGEMGLFVANEDQWWFSITANSDNTGTGAFRGPFPNGNIAISETGLSVLTPNSPASGDGTNNIAIGNGAMTLSKTANATVAIGPSAGSLFGQSDSVIVNGSFTSGLTNWTGANWVDGTGKATHTPGDTTGLAQVVGMDGGIPYALTYTVLDRTAGTVTPKTDGGGVVFTGVARSTNNTFTEYLRARDGNTQLDFVPSTDFDGSITNIKFDTLAGRSSVFLGGAAGQYVLNGPSNTFIGAFAGQSQEKDANSGLDISGTNGLNGTNNTAVGEATFLHMIRGASSNCGIGYNAGFSLTTGSANIAIGVAAMFEATTAVDNTIMGSSAYRAGFGSNNTLIGFECGYGSIAFSALVGGVTIGDKSFTVADGTIFTIGGKASNNTFLQPDTTVTNVVGNVITVDKASWNTLGDLGGAVLVASIAAPATGSENVGLGYLNLFTISGAAQRNTSIGAQAGRFLTTGSSNTLVGRQAGNVITTGSGNICIGQAANPSGATVSNELNIGDAITATGLGGTPVVTIADLRVSGSVAADYRANTNTTKALTTGAVWSAAALVAFTDTATIAVDMSTGINFSFTMVLSRTLGNPTNTKVGQSGLMIFTQDATGSRVLSYSSNYKFVGGLAPILTTTAGAIDVLHYFVKSSTEILVWLSPDMR